MFFNRAGWILDGHVPAAEIDHAPTHLPVGVIQWGLLQLGSCSSQDSRHVHAIDQPHVDPITK
jgi:hypothetical protein